MLDFYPIKKTNNSKIKFAFFTRNGGYSSDNFSTLNCSYSSGDKKRIIEKNIKMALKKINLDKKILKTTSQIHSSNVVLINNKNINKHIEADGMITQDHNISIGVLTADCCPIFFYDKEASFISCIHSGWKGTYENIVNCALKKIFQIQPNKKNIKAVIGPCLSKKNFEVDISFKKRFINKDKNNKYYFFNKINNKKSFFDMRALIKYQIMNNDITNIEDIDLDTYSNKNLFFSHRRSTHSNNLPTGRMINIIGFG